jgi:uncharacterized membrane protein SirB2
LKSLHVALAYITVVGFILRGIWSMLDDPEREARWVKIAPHVIDSMLLVLGITMALSLSISPLSGWLAAKLVGLLCYIGFGVVTMRASTIALKLTGFVGALLAIGYIFAVALSREAWPF